MTRDFTATLLVDQSPTEVFDSINRVRDWWGEGIEGGTEQPGDEFVYRHKDLHYSKQKLVEVVPEKRIVWLVTESDLTFLTQPDEWNGTTISFDISAKDGKTQLQFTHWGLRPEVECFEACSGGWSYYLHQSLLPLITTGKGNPDKKWNTTEISNA